MHHSLANSQSSWNFSDRLIDIGENATIAAGTVLAVVVTYTVPANVIALIEGQFISVDPTTTVGQAQAFFRINRSGTNRVALRTSSIVGQINNQESAAQILLEAGDIVDLLHANADAAGKLIQASCFIREIDL